jgi:pimeloyl-ACP methyl ester carboxylesterase
MSLDFSAVPRMPDGRTALETIESVAATSRAVKVPMGNGGGMMWHIWGEGSGKPTLLLFHGGSGSWIHWIRNVLPLSEHFTVYACRHAGPGRQRSAERRARHLVGDRLRRPCRA